MVVLLVFSSDKLYDAAIRLAVYNMGIAHCIHIHDQLISHY